MKALRCGILFGLVLACAARGELRLPEPPRQHTAWRPDASIPTNILSAVDKLFEQGFPDPRGCEYREIEVAVSGVWAARFPSSKLAAGCCRKKPGQINVLFVGMGWFIRLQMSTDPPTCTPKLQIQTRPLPGALVLVEDLPWVRNVQSSMRTPLRRALCCCCVAVKPPPR